VTRDHGLLKEFEPQARGVPSVCNRAKLFSSSNINVRGICISRTLVRTICICRASTF